MALKWAITAGTWQEPMQVEQDFLIFCKTFSHLHPWICVCPWVGVCKATTWNTLMH